MAAPATPVCNTATNIISSTMFVNDETSNI